jgi:histone deacetylase 1/2
MHKMKSFADVMAAAGVPLTDDELVDYIITRLGSAFNSIAANLTLGNASVPYSVFYSAVLSFEALQAQQAQAEEWSSSANAASRPAPYGQQQAPYGYHSHSRPQENNPQGGNRGNRPYSHQGQGRPNGNGGNGRNEGNSGGNGRNGGSNGRNGGRRYRPQCQLCGIWGHKAMDCRNRYNPEYRCANPHAGYSASTNSHENPPWYLDTGATDHLTSDLERLHVHERYGGKDQVQVANGSGLSISHIGNSCLTGSSLHLKDVLHVPHIRKNLLSVYRLVSDNDVFVEFHHHGSSTPSLSTKRHHPFVRLHLVSRSRLHSGISISFILRIM